MSRADETFFDRVRAAFAAAREAEDPILREVFPFRVRLGDTLVDSVLAQRRLMWAAQWVRFFELSKAGAVVMVLGALLLEWPQSTVIAAAVILVVAWVLRRRGLMRAMAVATWLDEAEVAPGAVVLANAALLAPGEEAAPASFLVSRDPALAADEGRFTALARKCFDLGQQSGELPAEQARLRDWLQKSQEAQRFDRIPVPPSMAAGADAFLVGTVVFRHQLVDQVLDRAVYPLALRPDIDESADVLPADLWRPLLDRGEDPS